MKSLLARSLIALILATLCALPAGAADYPDRTIHVVVPWPPGGPTDAVARTISQEISEALHQPVVIDNKAGSTGTVGSDYVAKASWFAAAR